MQVVGITGRKCHGKDSVARELAEQGFVIARFADPLKAMLRAFYAAHELDANEIERRIEGDLKEVPCEFLNGRTPRHAMQTLGAEWGRDRIHTDLWTDSLKRRVNLKEKVAIPDVRYSNECEVIRELGGKVVRIDASKRIPPNEHSGHSSETAVDRLQVDIEIDNNGTPFELHCAVRAAFG